MFRLKTVGDVVAYYSTPVRGVNAYDDLIKNQDNLPPNLHVIAEPIIFDPLDKTTFYKGIDAYPGTVDRFRGLRWEEKYPSKKRQFRWPDI